MAAFWSGTTQDFLAANPHALANSLAWQQAHRFASVEPQQLRAWTRQIAILRTALPATIPADSRLLLEFPLLRLGRRIDAILITPGLLCVLEFKDKAGFEAGDLIQVEDYALDLHDFHAGSRRLPIVPILVSTDARSGDQPWPLLLPGSVTQVLKANATSLPGLLAGLLAAAGSPTIDPLTWERSPYRPVPTIIDAARTLYAGHGVEDIANAGAPAQNLTRTTTHILAAIAAAKEEAAHAVIFVTGIPGAGKTLCGLNVAFSALPGGAVFLTGNPTLVHVFREALARDAAGGQPGKLRLARQRTESAIQALPNFRDYYVGRPDEHPAEHVAVIDEAQRAWSADHAVRKSRDRVVALTQSEPAHLLDIMARQSWSAIVCLVGGGQEIHTGEGGLAEWAAALRERPIWRVHAAPTLTETADPRKRLGDLPGLVIDPDLHLDIPIRSLRSPVAAKWVDLVLAGDQAAARALAAEAPLPFCLTRDLAAMRRHLRRGARGNRRAGLLASAGAARLRADGLGVELPHMDPAAVARWFLDRWPDVRASDALEVVATEFSCQGLELDHAGLCWGGDLIVGDGERWEARRFQGTRWQSIHTAESVANRLNTYRVLLTRARYETVIWVPLGDPADRTRDPAVFEAIADRLLGYGVGPLAEGFAEDIATEPDVLAALV